MLRFSTMLCALLAACGGGSGGDAGSRFDAGSPTDAGPGRRDVGVFDAGQPCVAALPVDILWVVDNSNSMAQEQGNLAINFPALVQVLTTPPDADGDGEPDRPAVEDLRVGVVTTDIGVGSVTGVPMCTGAGDDGILVSTSRSLDPACSGVTVGPPAWLDFGAGDDVDAFSRTFSCLARLGTDGCGLEQQLEAGLAAVDGRNAGFVRPDSLLAIVFVTDEDDCSAADDRIFDPLDPSPFGRRCADRPEALHPIDRYVSGFGAVRGAGDRNVVVAAITGVPRELVRVPSLIDYDALLADEAMQYREDPSDPARLLPACEVAGTGSADPARRIVQAIKPFAERGDGVVQSICSADLRPAIEAIAEVIASRLCGPLL